VVGSIANQPFFLSCIEKGGDFDPKNVNRKLRLRLVRHSGETIILRAIIDDDIVGRTFAAVRVPIVTLGLSDERVNTGQKFIEGLANGARQ